jgi:hypothetical protein
MVMPLSLALRAAAAAWTVALLAAAADHHAAPPPPNSEVAAMQRWILRTRDHEGVPFAVIDKRGARLWLFSAAGDPLGDAPVLLGRQRGDASVEGIGERPLAQVRPDERTTPAGRFVALPGHNAAGEDIFWVDYPAAVSMHRVRATVAAERRLQRLASPTVADNRITWGCINVPAAFYDARLRPLFQQSRRGVVYILPEVVPAARLFTPAS